MQLIKSLDRKNQFGEEGEIILQILKENIFVTDDNDLNEILKEKIGAFQQILWKDLFYGLKEDFLGLREIYEKKVESLEKNLSNLLELNEAQKNEILNLTESLKEKEQLNIILVKENSDKIKEMVKKHKYLNFIY